MTFEEYREEILNGEKTDWHGELVPTKLLTPRVHMIANMIIESLTNLSMEIDEIHGNSKDKERKVKYMEDRWRHIKTLPYHSNGLISDLTLSKCKSILEEEEKKKGKTKPKTRKKRKKRKEVVTPKKTTKDKPNKVVKDKVNDKPKKEVKEEENKSVAKSRRGRNSKLIFGK